MKREIMYYKGTGRSASNDQMTSDAYQQQIHMKQYTQQFLYIRNKITILTLARYPHSPRTTGRLYS